MFKEFFNSLLIKSDNDSGFIDETGVLSLAAIFIRIAKVDGVFDKEELVDEKILKKEFSYAADENKFKFREYQNKILENLIEGIVEDIIFYLNYS